MPLKNNYKKLLLLIVLFTLISAILPSKTMANIFEFGNFKLKNVNINNENNIETKNKLFETKQTAIQTEQPKKTQKITIIPKNTEKKTVISNKPTQNIEKKPITTNKHKTLKNNPIKENAVKPSLAVAPKSIKANQPITEKNEPIKTITSTETNKQAEKINTVNESKETDKIAKQNAINKENTEEQPSILSGIHDYPNKKEITKTSETNFLQTPSKSSGPDFGTVIGGLAFVLLIIFIVWGLYMKITGKTPTLGASNGLKNKKKLNFNLLSSTSIGQGKDIHLVEINGKQMVLGSTANSINVLTELDNDENNEILNKELKSFAENAKIDNKQEEETMYNDPEIYENSYADLYKEYLEKTKKNNPE
ncbi:MAG: flagellar biosynthetic protein FliO [bacterium]